MKKPLFADKLRKALVQKEKEKKRYEVLFNVDLKR